MKHLEYWILQESDNNSGVCLGISLAGSQVKVLELNGSYDSLEVAHYATEPLPSGAIVDQKIMDLEAVSKAIATAVKKSGTRNKKAAICVPNSEVISKKLSIPAGMSPDEVEQHVLFKAPQLIPQPLENIYLDHQILGPDPEDNQREIVLIVACRRDSVDLHAEALKMAKLKPRFIDIEEHAARNAATLIYQRLPLQGENETIAVFDMGLSICRLFIQHNREHLYSRDTDFNGQALSYELINQFGLSSTDQLTEYLADGRLAGEEVEATVAAFAQQAAAHIEDVLQFYFSTEAESDHIDRILIAGDCAIYPSFTRALQEHLDWKVSLANPLTQAKAAELPKRMHVGFYGPSLMVPVGLSLRSVIWRKTDT